jgi:hypothetical protein
MAEVINLDKRRRQRREILLEAAGRLARCAGCQFRCARCGFRVEGEPLVLPELGLLLCGPCRTEYQVYQERLRGASEPEFYWQNEAWMETWRSWLAHQRAVSNFRRSKEFQRLLSELISHYPV